MRAYAMLLALAVTVGYGFVAEVAAWSVGAGRVVEAAAPGGWIGADGAPGQVWYGGTLDPVTVEARGDSPARTAAARRSVLDRSSTRCSKPRQPHTAVS